MDIKERIKKGMALRGMTASELAQKSGVNKGLISKYLKGTVEPKQSTIYELARALRVSPAWLIGYDDSNEEMIDTVVDEQLIEIENGYKGLNEKNRMKLSAYLQALIDSQEVNDDTHTTAAKVEQKPQKMGTPSSGR